MYSIHFASQTPTTTHSVKRTIRDGGTIPTFHENLLMDKDMVDHHHFKDRLLIINFTREINLMKHYLSLHISLPIKEKLSFEDTLQQFMQSQVITNQTQDQISHNQNQAIAWLEVQID